MQLEVTWPNHTHFLLAGADVALTLAGQPVTIPVTPGRAVATVPSGGLPPAVVELTVAFKPGLGGSSAPVLRVQQRFELLPLPDGPRATQYVVQPTGGGAPVAQAGRHPLLSSVIDPTGARWQVVIETAVVDASSQQPRLLDKLRRFRTARTANVRVLARTDGRLPLHFICATPPSCTTAQVTDVVGFLTAPQRSKPAVDSDEGLQLPQHFRVLQDRIATFLGTPVHTGALTPIEFDHFTQPRGQLVPNVVTLRRWEDALVASDRRVALVQPAPQDGRHNDAATGRLPVILREVHAALVAVGDIAAPAGSAPGRPLLAAAAHSAAGLSLFEATRASAKDAFKELWLFEARTADKQIALLAATDPATQILIAGYEQASSENADRAARAHPKLSGRVRRLPETPPAPGTRPEAVAVSTPLLRHALEGILPRADDWRAPVHRLPGGDEFHERFEVLHQHIVQGDDADGTLFLAKALLRSTLR
jgi:hypothetical protein